MFTQLRALVTRPLSGKGYWFFGAAPVSGNDWPSRMVPANQALIPGKLQGSGWIVGGMPNFEHVSLEASGIAPALVSVNVTGNGLANAQTPRTVGLLLDKLMAAAAPVGKGG